MAIEFQGEVMDRMAQREENEKRIIALSEKIANMIAAESMSVDMAERALRRVETIMRTRTIVSFTCP